MSWVSFVKEIGGKNLVSLFFNWCILLYIFTLFWVVEMPIERNGGCSLFSQHSERCGWRLWWVGGEGGMYSTCIRQYGSKLCFENELYKELNFKIMTFRTICFKKVFPTQSYRSLTYICFKDIYAKKIICTNCSLHQQNEKSLWIEHASSLLLYTQTFFFSWWYSTVMGWMI